MTVRCVTICFGFTYFTAVYAFVLILGEKEDVVLSISVYGVCLLQVYGAMALIECNYVRT